MATMKLSNNTFTLIPEGYHIFKIMEVDDSKYDDFGKLVVKMQTKEGKTHIERFTLIKSNGELNNGALKAWSFFARTCLNNNSADEIDTQDIVGCYLGADVEYETYSKADGTEGTSERLKNYKVETGFKNNQIKVDESAIPARPSEWDDLDF